MRAPHARTGVEDRSSFTLDLSAIAENTARLRGLIGDAELWAVVKGDAYGHGALDTARVALESGASALCVATVGEGVELREQLPRPRIIILTPTPQARLSQVALAKLEQTVTTAELYAAVPSQVAVHLKLNTGMNRWGFAELPPVRGNVVAVMSQFASAGVDRARCREQLELFDRLRAPRRDLTAHIANSAATLLHPESHLDAVRCGATLLGLSPLGEDPANHGLRPALRWTSYIAQVHDVRAGERVGYGDHYRCVEDTRIGIVPVGYADGFRRDLVGTRILVDDELCPVVGTISMDALAVVAPSCRVGDRVVLAGDGVLLEHHAAVADTMSLEIASQLSTDRRRATRTLIRRSTTCTEAMTD